MACVAQIEAGACAGVAGIETENYFVEAGLGFGQERTDFGSIWFKNRDFSKFIKMMSFYKILKNAITGDFWNHFQRYLLYTICLGHILIAPFKDN